MENLDNQEIYAIEIIHKPLSDDKHEIVEQYHNDNDMLKEIMEAYVDEFLKPNNIDVFVEKDNIVVTEKGYFITVYGDVDLDME